MNMTHYMELLANNQPWNLLIFMAVPIVLAETIAVTELYILYTRSYDGPVRAWASCSPRSWIDIVAPASGSPAGMT